MLAIENAALVIGVCLIRIEMNHLIEIRDGLCAVTFLGVDLSAIGKRKNIRGIETNCLVRVS